MCKECGGSGWIPTANDKQEEACPVCSSDAECHGARWDHFHDRATALAPIVGLAAFVGLAWTKIFQAMGVGNLDAWAWGLLVTLLAAGALCLFLTGRDDYDE